MNYSPLFLDFYEDYGNGMDKDVFAEHVASKMPEFQDPRDMYEPIDVRVKLVGGHDHYNGAAEFSVAYTDNKWHQKLCRAVARTMGLSDSTISSMELRDIEGSLAQNMSADELAHAGELQVFIRNQPRRVAGHDVPRVPTEYSTNKQSDIAAWFDSIRYGLSTDVSQTLSTATNWQELKQMLRPGDKVQREIQQYIEEHPGRGPNDEAWSWPEFVRVYSMDDVARNDTEGASAVSQKIASKLLNGIKVMIKASHEEITNHFNQLKSKQGAQEDEDFWSEGTESSAVVSAPIGSNMRAPQHMFYDIVEDGLVPSHIGRGVVMMLYRRHKPQVQNTKTRLVKTNSAQSGRARYTRHVRAPQTNGTGGPTEYYRHPYYDYLHGYYYPTNERHSAHYMANHGKIDMTPSANYPGNAARVMDKFSVLTRNPRYPVNAEIMEEYEDDDLVPINSNDMPDLVPIKSNDMPDLVPIAQLAPFERAPRVRPRTRLIETELDFDEDEDDVDIPNIMDFIH